MANTYAWSITNLECYAQIDGHDDVVFTIHWTRSATDGENHVANIYGVQQMTLDAEAPFTAYSDLTEAQVVGWVEEALGAEYIAALDLELDQQVADQINPPVVSPPPPWATPPA
jgi:hypothetical protein